MGGGIRGCVCRGSGVSVGGRNRDGRVGHRSGWCVGRNGCSARRTGGLRSRHKSRYSRAPGGCSPCPIGKKIGAGIGRHGPSRSAEDSGSSF